MSGHGPGDPEPGWPPLVGGRLPLAVRVRDIVLTLAAWAVLAWLLRDAIALAVDFLRAPIFELTDQQPPDWKDLRRRLRPFMQVSGVLVCWLMVWSLIRSKRMRAVPPSPQPEPLPLCEHAAALGVDPGAAEGWRREQIVVIAFDAADRIAGASPVTPSRSPSRSSPALPGS
jgi:poly-beta-1,6-N-acetyl-D-glucosamine biosynthesis protein PgaD